MTITAFVVGAIAVLALATWVAVASQPPGQPTPWREDVALALMVTGSIAAVAGGVWMLAVGTFTSGDIGHVRSASRSRRTAATRAIRHGQPVAPEEVELTSAIARTTVRRRATTPAWLGTSAACAGLILLAPQVNVLALTALGATALSLALTAPTFADIARARCWLNGVHHQQ